MMVLNATAIDLIRRYVKHLRGYGMNAIEIHDIWQAIRESERSDEIQFMNDQILTKAEAIRLTQQPDQSGAVGLCPAAPHAQAWLPDLGLVIQFDHVATAKLDPPGRIVREAAAQ